MEIEKQLRDYLATDSSVLSSRYKLYVMSSNFLTFFHDDIYTGYQTQYIDCKARVCQSDSEKTADLNALNECLKNCGRSLEFQHSYAMHSYMQFQQKMHSEMQKCLDHKDDFDKRQECLSKVKTEYSTTGM